MRLTRFPRPALSVPDRNVRLHFIPLSSSYSEIYNIHAFFSGPTPETLRAANASGLLESPSAPLPEAGTASPGERRLRRIARAGKQWKMTMGRPEDMEGERFAFLDS